MTRRPRPPPAPWPPPAGPTTPWASSSASSMTRAPTTQSRRWPHGGWAWPPTGTPAERAFGTRAYEQDVLGGRLPAAAVVSTSAKVRDMIGDSSPAVREQVARTLGALVDKSTIDALTVQLAQEPEPSVKVEIIK